MVQKLILKIFVVWLVILVLAIANGILRETLLSPAFGEFAGLFFSGVLLSGLILVVAYVLLPWFGPVSVANYAAGLAWLCLTLVFEFTFGYFIQNKALPQLLDAYTFKDGNIWPIVLLTTVAAPYIAARIRGQSRGNT